MNQIEIIKSQNHQKEKCFDEENDLITMGRTMIFLLRRVRIILE